MRIISGREFEKATSEDPSWASKLTCTSPVRVVGAIELAGSKITHLSPHLHFDGNANFRYCENLKIAEGTFDNWVDFTGSNIEKVKIQVQKTSHSARMLCNLSQTPLVRKDPMKAAEHMTGSRNHEDWETMRAVAKETGWHEYAENLRRAVLQAKKAKMASLSKEGPLEI
jgi:hypothetical protein